MSYTSTLQCRDIRDAAVPVVVVQEGNLFVFGGSAAWAVPSPIYFFLSKPFLLFKLGQHQVIVIPSGHAFATAVPEKDDFVTNVAQAELGYRHFLVCQ